MIVSKNKAIQLSLITQLHTKKTEEEQERESEPNRTEVQSITMEEVRNAKQWQVHLFYQNRFYLY